MGRREHMLDTHLLKELFNSSVLKLRSVITSYLLDSQVELILSPSQEFLQGSLGFTFILQKEYSSEACIIINNY
jgi:hypothetical protein